VRPLSERLEVPVPLRPSPRLDEASGGPAAPPVRALPPLRLYCRTCGHRLRLDFWGNPPQEHKPRRSGFGCLVYASANAGGPLLWTCRGKHTWHRVVPEPDWRKARCPA
jgi:hypothetical protein